MWSFIYGPLIEFESAPDGYSSTCRDTLPENEKNWFELEVEESVSLLRLLTLVMAAALDVDPDTIESSFSWSWVGGRARPTANLKMIRGSRIPTSQELDVICSTTALKDARKWIRCLKSFSEHPPKA